MLSRKNILVCGMKEQGKTTLIVQMCKAAHQQQKGAHKVLFLMSSDPIPTEGIERLQGYDALLNFCKQNRGIAKFYDFSDGLRPLDKPLTFLNKYFRNGILVIEDATPLMRGNLPTMVRDWYTNHKNKGVDLFTAYHSINVPPYIAEEAGLTDIVIFKTLGKYKVDYIDGAFKHEIKAKFPLIADEILKAVHAVEKKPHNPKTYIQYHELISTGR